MDVYRRYTDGTGETWYRKKGGCWELTWVDNENHRDLIGRCYTTLTENDYTLFDEDKVPDHVWRGIALHTLVKTN